MRQDRTLHRSLAAHVQKARAKHRGQQRSSVADEISELLGASATGHARRAPPAASVEQEGPAVANVMQTESRALQALEALRSSQALYAPATLPELQRPKPVKRGAAVAPAGGAVGRVKQARSRGRSH